MVTTWRGPSARSVSIAQPGVRRTIAILLWSALLAAPSPAFAQEREPPPPGTELEQRLDELATWLREYEAWERWFEQWGNRVSSDFDDETGRRKRPAPPVWLEAECRDFWGNDGPLASACYLLRHWDEQPFLILQRRHTPVGTAGGRPQDKVEKTTFFRRVHLTGLWGHAQYPATQTYGIIGMQVSVFETGRLTLPAIGVMLVMVPDGEGGHAWKPGTTVGFGYRLCDFVPPLIKRQVSLHFNVARTNVHGVRDDRLFPGGLNLNLIGLSISPTRRK
jgi:hypothetical protein